MDKKQKGTRVPKPQTISQVDKKIHQGVFEQTKADDPKYKAQVVNGDKVWGSTLNVSRIDILTIKPEALALQAAEGLVRQMRKEQGLPLIEPDQTNEPDYLYAAQPLLSFALDMRSMPDNVVRSIDGVKRAADKAVSDWDRLRCIKQTAGERVEEYQTAVKANEKKPCKRFHRSDSLNYNYQTISMVKPMFGGYAPKPFDGQLPDFDSVERHGAMLHAAPHVDWVTIVNEWEQLRTVNANQIDDNYNNPVMKTITVEYPEFVVGLTYRGFTKLVEQCATYGRSEYGFNVEQVAKGLVADRDYQAYCKSTPDEKRTLPFKAFYPKD
jgi:hypothetical protein